MRFYDLTNQKKHPRTYSQKQNQILERGRGCGRFEQKETDQFMATVR